MRSAIAEPLIYKAPDALSFALFGVVGSFDNTRAAIRQQLNSEALGAGSTKRRDRTFYPLVEIARGNHHNTPIKNLCRRWPMRVHEHLGARASALDAPARLEEERAEKFAGDGDLGPLVFP